MSEEETNPFSAPEAEILSPEPDRPPVNPWREIWLRPAPTIRALLDWRPGYRTYPLAVLNGIVMTTGAVQPPLPREIQTVAAAGMAVFFWSLFGVLWLHLLGRALTAAGRLEGGKGTAPELRCAAAWGFAPSVLELLVRTADWQAWIPYELAAMLGFTLFSASAWIGISGAREAHRLSTGTTRASVALTFTWLVMEGIVFQSVAIWVSRGIRWTSFLLLPMES